MLLFQRKSWLYPLIAFSMILAACTPSLRAQDWARAKLETSPRHREWVKLQARGHTLDTFVVFPERASKAPVVVLIHEIFGLSDWAREMADELAGAGYIVVAPDLLSGAGPNGGGSSDFKDAAGKPDMEATVESGLGTGPGAG